MRTSGKLLNSRCDLIYEKSSISLEISKVLSFNFFRNLERVLYHFKLS
ncbi:hypothetical protein LEP1GSC021_4223 [Leptospira noguchii str. 1993005606]|nr:hypothetical protein LEP1GSC021_4223 [Leptospira noguchii str. 1993005606]